MDARQLAEYVFDDAGHQLSNVLAGFPTESFDKQMNEKSFSAMVTVTHLAEAYVAGQKHDNGEEHEWGTYQIGTADPEEAVATMKAEREKFKKAAIAKGTDEALKTLLMYGSNHDYYHVGQLCTARQVFEPTWDPYSIYKE